MRAWVRFVLADDTEVQVEEGGLVGRATGAALRLDGPGVSEAHALVSLRGGALRLLALRGRVRVDDVAVGEVALRPGQRLVLGAGTALRVDEVHLPADVAPPIPPTVGGEVRGVRVRFLAGVVELAEGDSPSLRLGGNQAELVRLLADAPEPMHWSQIARYFWPERDQPKWRDRFDAMIREVRGKLRDHGLRTDLLWSWDGTYSLRLLPGDDVLRAE